MDLPLKYAFKSLEEDYVEGRFDCAIFLARWADISSGSAIEEKLAGTYTNKIDGLRKYAKTIKEAPFTVSRLAVPFLEGAGWVKRESGVAQGDIVEGKGWALAIMTGLGPVSLGMGSTLVIHRISDIKGAWYKPNREEGA